MATCLRCGSENTFGNGPVRSIAKRYCKDCHYQLTRPDKVGKSLSIKLTAVSLNLHGISMNAILRLPGVSTPAVLKWILLMPRRIALSLFLAKYYLVNTPSLKYDSLFET
jgi:transposase-like protein